MKTLLNIISTLSAFGFGIGCLYMLMDATLGRLEILKSEFEWYGLQTKDIIFLLLSVLIFLCNVSIIYPY